MTAPVQPPADLHQRIAQALRDAAYDCDGHCGLDEQECLAQHPIEVAVEHHGVATDVYGPITALAAVAADALQPELAALATLRALLNRGTHPTIPADLHPARLIEELAAENERLDAELAALREQLAEARQQFAAVAAQRDRLRTRMNNLADRWDAALAVDKPYARALRAEISVAPFNQPT